MTGGKSHSIVMNICTLGYELRHHIDQLHPQHVPYDIVRERASDEPITTRPLVPPTPLLSAAGYPYGLPIDDHETIWVPCAAKRRGKNERFHTIRIACVHKH